MSGMPSGTCGVMIRHHLDCIYMVDKRKYNKPDNLNFKVKPETGQNLSGKFFLTKISKFIDMFDGIIKISLGRAVFSISNTWSNKITTTTK